MLSISYTSLVAEYQVGKFGLDHRRLLLVYDIIGIAIILTPQVLARDGSIRLLFFLYHVIRTPVPNDQKF